MMKKDVSSIKALFLSFLTLCIVIKNREIMKKIVKIAEQKIIVISEKK